MDQHFNYLGDSLPISAMNDYGKKLVSEHGIDANGDEKIQGDELLELFKVSDKPQIGISYMIEKEDGKSTSRLYTSEVQAAIQNYNNYKDQGARRAVMNVYAEALRKRADDLKEGAKSAFGEYDSINEHLTSIYQLIIKRDILQIEEEATENFEEKTANLEKTLATMQKELQKQADELGNRLADALISYGGEDVFGNQDSTITEKANVAINKTNALKQDFKSTFDKLRSYNAELKNCTTKDEKIIALNRMMNLIDDLSDRIENNKQEVSEAVATIVKNAASNATKTEELVKNPNSEYKDISADSDPYRNPVANNILYDVLLDAPKAEDFSPNGIETVKTDDTKSKTVYTLDGKPVTSKLQKGAYIENGKKIIVK